ncbi:predicted protein [Sclerotinia sclerotiorum 1980 UF-70]|uniref:Uncharacterized protein n=1 Tax=Sclerotinia sclerotiorum (strain ATCC 18683 / 1980 / Ss-1) TaxID=665079 RepID=A7ESI9_SCLS1|nr:predicted protein [Sclerotinia sclerotiorum 1980 UF-70]EDN92431.1 predicted protein [Sclerotinia sclerotiorum 1980 UF-70]
MSTHMSGLSRILIFRVVAPAMLIVFYFYVPGLVRHNAFRSSCNAYLTQGALISAYWDLL